jgi:hypothetical protein
LHARDCYHRPVNNSSPADKHRTLVITRRRWTAYFAVPFAVGLFISGIYFALIVYDNLPKNFAFAAAALTLFSALCVAIPVGRSAWIALTNKEPALIVDSRGITDQFHLNAFLPWSDLKSVSLEYGDGSSLAIVLRDGAKGSGGTPAEPSLTRTLKRAFTGADLTIPLGSLTYDPNKLRALLTYYTKQ